MSSEMNTEGMQFPVKPHNASLDAEALAGSRTHKRRPHTKSRNGCTTCKRRRVKCDETRPVCRNCQHLRLECRYVSPASLSCADLQIMNLKLLHHYDLVVAKTISDAGISTLDVWATDVVEMGLKYPFLMHAILMFSATHLARREPKEYCNSVVQHRSEALTLLRNDVQHINAENLDALVAASVLLILDALANAAVPSRMTPSSLPASTWLHHVRGAATILLAVGVLPPTSKFYSFMGVDLLDLASCYSLKEPTSPGKTQYSSLTCFMPELRELYPVALDSPYFSSLAFLDKLHSQRSCPDFILRVFSFPALMDREFVRLIAANDSWAKRIVSAYYRLVREYIREMRDRVWFLDGVSTVLPIDMDSQYGGLGFITDALPVSQNVDSILAKFDASFSDPRGAGDIAMMMSEQRAGSQTPGVRTSPTVAHPANAGPVGTNTGGGVSKGGAGAALNGAHDASASNQRIMGAAGHPGQTQPNGQLDSHLFHASAAMQAQDQTHPHSAMPHMPMGASQASQDSAQQQRSQSLPQLVGPVQQQQQSSIGQAGNPSNMSRAQSALSPRLSPPGQAPNGVNGVNGQQSSVNTPLSAQLPHLQPHGQKTVDSTPLTSGYNSSSTSALPSPANASQGASPDTSANGNGQSYSTPPGVTQSLNQGMYFNDIAPHSYGRIHKQVAAPANYDFVPVPGSGARLSQPQLYPRSRTNSRPIRPMAPRNRNIIRPGMMGLPIDPSVPEDLLGDFDFADIEYPGIEEGAYGMRDIIFDTNTLEWKPVQPSGGKQFNTDATGGSREGQQTQQGASQKRDQPHVQGPLTQSQPPSQQTQQSQQQQQQAHQSHQVQQSAHQQQSQQSSQQARQSPQQQQQMHAQSQGAAQSQQQPPTQNPVQHNSDDAIVQEPFLNVGIQDIKEELTEHEFRGMIDFEDTVNVSDPYREFS